MYPKYLMDLYGRCINVYVPHIKLLQSTVQQGALYKYLTCIAEQIWIPHCTCVFHCTATNSYNVVDINVKE